MRTLVFICISLMIAVSASRTRKSAAFRSGKTSRMVGGQPINARDVPFIVSIKNVPFDYHKCAGFVVDSTHVVTTATCLYPATKGQAQAYIYPSTLDTLEKGYEIIDWVIHYNYSVLPRENDIAVATLKEPITIDGPFEIPELSKWATLPKAAEVTTYGWGYSKVDRDRYGNFTIHSKDLRVMSNAMCSLLLHQYLRCDTICASSDSQFASAPADVGTPLLYTNGETKYLVGMLVMPTEKLVSAATFASLYEYRDFILEVTQSKTPTTSPAGPPSQTTPTPTTTPTTTTTTEDDDDYHYKDGDGDDEYSDESEDDVQPGRRRKARRN